MVEKSAPHQHPFLEKPHRTLVAFSFPVLLSLVAEPLTGLVDTAFVAGLGATSLAALGVGTAALTSVFWAFNFLGIGSQTEVAKAFGRGDLPRASRVNALALSLSGILGAALVIGGLATTDKVAGLMAAAGEVHAEASAYMRIRWFGAPAVLCLLSSFGVLRGLQDMRTPLWVAVCVNAMNIVLDALLIYGLGPFPAMGVQGAALASTTSQWTGAVWSAGIVLRRLGSPPSINFGEVSPLLRVGSDLFIRTGLLNLFLLLSTRKATQLGANAAAAHQAIRQVWIFTALFLDAFAITGQSLVAFFVGSRSLKQARKVAVVVCLWSVGTGLMLALIMLSGAHLAGRILVPCTSFAFFLPAWIIASVSQPLNAVSFATDGLNWGTGDFRFLRNVVIAATVFGVVALLSVSQGQPSALVHIWVITTLWAGIRAVFGVLRIWPGIGMAPLHPRGSD